MEAGSGWGDPVAKIALGSFHYQMKMWLRLTARDFLPFPEGDIKKTYAPKRLPTPILARATLLNCELLRQTRSRPSKRIDDMSDMTYS